MKQLIDYLHFYLGCDLKTDTGVVKLIAVQKEVIPCTDYRVICLNGNVTHELKGEFKPILRPLSDMTEDEILEVCKLFSPTAWGEYRFKKWVAKKDPKSNDSWISYDVTNENSTYSFTVDLIDGDIMLYDDDDYEPIHVDNNYRFWYVRNGFDIFGLIGSGLAIDKTTYNPKQV